MFTFSSVNSTYFNNFQKISQYPKNWEIFKNKNPLATADHLKFWLMANNNIHDNNRREKEKEKEKEIIKYSQKKQSQYP